MSISVLCELCKKPVLLEKARINESGKAVHEQCYLQAILVNKPGKPVRGQIHAPSPE
jgi:hypothetical protein